MPYGSKLAEGDLARDHERGDKGRHPTNGADDPAREGHLGAEGREDGGHRRGSRQNSQRREHERPERETEPSPTDQEVRGDVEQESEIGPDSRTNDAHPRKENQIDEDVRRVGGEDNRDSPPSLTEIGSTDRHDRGGAREKDVRRQCTQHIGRSLVPRAEEDAGDRFGPDEERRDQRSLQDERITERGGEGAGVRNTRAVSAGERRSNSARHRAGRVLEECDQSHRCVEESDRAGVDDRADENAVDLREQSPRAVDDREAAGVCHELSDSPVLDAADADGSAPQHTHHEHEADGRAEDVAHGSAERSSRRSRTEENEADARSKLDRALRKDEAEVRRHRPLCDERDDEKPHEALAEDRHCNAAQRPGQAGVAVRRRDQVSAEEERGADDSADSELEPERVGHEPCDGRAVATVLGDEASRGRRDAEVGRQDCERPHRERSVGPSSTTFC